MLKSILYSTVFACTALGAATATLAEPVRVASQVPVAEAVLRLTGAVEAAGARVFTVLDFQEGNASVGQELRPTTLVIFGSPKIGAASLSVGQTMALDLPLKILAYQDADGAVWLMHDDPAEVAQSHGIPADHPAVLAMQGALARMTTAASGG